MSAIWRSFNKRQDKNCVLEFFQWWEFEEGVCVWREMTVAACTTSWRHPYWANLALQSPPNVPSHSIPVRKFPNQAHEWVSRHQSWPKWSQGEEDLRRRSRCTTREGFKTVLTLIMKAVCARAANQTTVHVTVYWWRHPYHGRTCMVWYGEYPWRQPPTHHRIHSQKVCCGPGASEPRDGITGFYWYVWTTIILVYLTV